MAESAAQPPAGSKGVARLTPTHQLLLEAMLANPALTHRQLADQIGFSSKSWVGEIIRSEVFQRELLRRRRELMQPVEEQFQALLSRSLEVLQAKLDRPAQEVSDALAARTLEVASRALGYGAAGPPPAPKGEVNVVAHLEELARNLEPLLKRRTQVVDGEVVAPPAALPDAG